MPDEDEVIKKLQLALKMNLLDLVAEMKYLMYLAMTPYHQKTKKKTYFLKTNINIKTSAIVRMFLY